MKGSSRDTWTTIESGLIFIFLLDVVVTFFFNLLKFGWLTNIMWLKLNVTDAFGLSGWSVSIWSGILVFILIPFTLVSVVLLFSSIVKPSWFKTQFRVKYWYGIFIAQILTWILITNF